MNRATRWLVPLGLALALLLGLAGQANAQKVGNPGTYNFKITSGELKVKDQSFGFDESQNINFNGTVAANGAISIPSMTFPNFPISASGFDLTVKINVVGPTTGTINPLTGDMSLLLRVWIKIDGVPFGGDCRIASSSSPITLNTLVTGTSGSVTGTKYNLSAGTVRIVNGTYAVPESSSCGPAAGTVNSTVGLPSAAGNNTALFNILTTPKLTRGVTAALNASPTSGTAPFTTTLNAAGSTASAGIKEYRWDFTNDGTIDQTTTTATVNRTYTTGGTPTARVVVVDNDNDTAEATRQLTVNAFPDLELTAAHTGNFRVGNVETYRVNLKNVGYAATTGGSAVTSTLPAGLTYDSVTGTGWSCSTSGQNLTCNRANPIAVGANAPELGIRVKVGAEARPEVTPTFTVTTTGDNGPGNNSATDQTNVTATDLKLNLSHPSHAILIGPDPANVIRLSVDNIGDAATVGPTVITDELPAGLAPVSAAGPGWSCDIAGQTVTCTHSGTIAPGASSGEIEIAVSGSLDPEVLGVTVDNQASVSTANDIDPANDTVVDPTLILDGHDVGIIKGHAGSFTAGKTADYTLAVTNSGVAPTTGPTVVTDVLPSGLTYVSADGGPDWDCADDSGTVTCTHEDPLAAGADAPPIDLRVQIGVEAIPIVTNTATVATADDPNPANDSSADETIVQAIDLQITKNHTGVIRVGQPATYRLGVTNVGDSPTTDQITVTDQLPSGLAFVSVDGGADWNCSEAAGVVSCTYDEVLESAQSAPDIELKVMVGPAAAPEVTNEASVSTLDDFNPANDSTSDPADVIDADTAVSIERTGTFRPGQNGTYQVTVRNEGTVPTANPTEVVATLAAGLDFVSAGGNGWICDELDGVVTCNGPASLAGETTAAAINIRVLVTSAAAPSAITTVTATTDGDRYADNDQDSDEAEISTPDLAIAASHDADFRVGDEGTWSIDVSNGGSSATTGPVTVTATVPAGIDVLSAEGQGWDCPVAGQAVTCERVAPIAAGGSATSVTLVGSPTAASLPVGETSAGVTLEAGVQTANDGNPTNDAASDATDLVAVDQALGMTGSVGLAVGEQAAWEIRIENTGSAATRGGTRVKDTLPAGFSAGSSGGEGWLCAATGLEVSCEYGAESVPGEQLPLLTIRARAGTGSAGTATNQATVETAGDVIAGNDSATLDREVSAAPDLEAVLKARAAAFRVGGDAGYEVRVRNVGAASADSPTTVKLQLPSGAGFVEADYGTGWSCGDMNGTEVTCEAPGEIGPDQISVLGFRLTFDVATAAQATVTATVENGADNNPENDQSSLESPVNRIDLALTRSRTGDWVRPGTGSYRLQVENKGTAATVAPVLITETLPLGTTLAAAQGQDWDCQVTGRVLRCVNRGPIPAGDGSPLDITVDIARVASSPVSASSTVKTADDVNSGNDTATERIDLNDAVPPVQSKAKIRAGKVTVTRSGVVTVWMSCPQQSAAKCRGTLKLRTSGKVAFKKVKRKFRKAKLNFGQAGYALAAGQSAPVRIQVKGKGKQALKLNRKINLRATATGQGVGNSNTRLVIRRGR